MPKARKSEQLVDSLNQKQQRFVDEYLIDLNATQAVIRAGYSPKTAQVQGARLLTNAIVQAKVAEGRAKQQERTGITADKVITEASRLAFFDVRKLCDSYGNPIPIHKLDAATAAAIQGIELVTEKDGEGFTVVRKYKVADKNSALEKLFKHLGLFERDNDQSNPAKAMESLLTMVNGSKLPLAK